MSPPRNDEGRPPARKARLHVERSDSNVHDGTDVVTSMRRYPVAYASLYAPSARRTRWWAAYVCPICDTGHFARTRTEAAAKGVRRSGCGRLIWLVIARTYRGEPREAYSR